MGNKTTQPGETQAQLEVLDFLREKGTEGASTREVAKAISMSETTARKLLKALTNVTTNGHGRWYVEVKPESNGHKNGKGGTGHKRPLDVVSRDAEVLMLLREVQLTKDEIAERLNIPPTYAYISLWRLHKAGQVSRTAGRTPTWSSTDTEYETA